jgi:hypothetical protein
VSLTSHLKDRSSAVRCFLHQEFPNSRAVVQPCRQTIADCVTIRPSVCTAAQGHFSTVGTALDYRLRYYFAVTPAHMLVAAKGALLLTNGDFLHWGGSGSVELPDTFRAEYGSRPVRAPSSRLIHDLFVSLETTLREFPPVGQRLCQEHEEPLARYCFVLALFEQIFRAGFAIQSPLYELKRRATVVDLLGIVPPFWADDLCSLSWVFYDRFADLLTKRAILNPTFDGSGDVGGADADFILDGCLVDIKATVDPARCLEAALYQLLGYTLLDYSDQYRIREVAIYLARQQLMLQWSLDELMSTMAEGRESSLPQLRTRFRAIFSSSQYPSTGTKR